LLPRLRDTNPETILKKAAKVSKEDEMNKRLEEIKCRVKHWRSGYRLRFVFPVSLRFL
jgi:hypothetical protein